MRSAEVVMLAPMGQEKALQAHIQEEIILSRIHIIRGRQVILDYELAELYEVETKYLKRQVRRNIERFPDDFMLELTKEEQLSLRS